MAVLYNALQWHEMFSHGPEVIGSNPVTAGVKENVLCEALCHLCYKVSGNQNLPSYKHLHHKHTLAHSQMYSTVDIWSKKHGDGHSQTVLDAHKLAQQSDDIHRKSFETVTSIWQHKKWWCYSLWWCYTLVGPFYLFLIMLAHMILKKILTFFTKVTELSFSKFSFPDERNWKQSNVLWKNT